MITISGHEGNANQNHTKILCHPWENSYYQKYHEKQMLMRMQGKPSYTAGGNVR
jgi:hypothetical protein